MESEGIFRVRHTESSFDGSKHKEQKQSDNPPPYNTQPYRSRESVDLVFWIAVAASQAAGIACVVLVIYWCNLYGGFAWTSNANLQFFVHPLLMVLGLVVCYGNAILVYRVLYFLPKWILKLVHAALHVSAIVLSSVGLAAVFENHRRTNKADLYSLHSWVGIATFGAFCLQYVGSFITFLFPGMPLTLRAQIMPFHTFFGLGIFLLAAGTAQMGLTERLLWTNNYTSNTYTTEGVVGNALGLIIIVFAFLVVFLATQNRYKRRPLPSEISPTN